MKEILNIRNTHKHFNGIQALQDFSCTVRKDEILGLIGPNGAGKSTLFNVLTGFISPDSGTAEYNGTDLYREPPDKISLLGISRTFQDLRLIRQISVLDNVLLSFKDQPGEKIRSLFIGNKAVLKTERENTEKAIELLKYAGIDDKANDPAGTLSYGQQKLLSIICCLAADPEVLLLDEPVAGINPAMIEKIISIIRELPSKGKSVIVIEHNMDVIMKLCHRVIFMDSGEKIAQGTPEEVRNNEKVIEAYIR